MKKVSKKILAVLAVIVLLGIYYYAALPAINIHSTEFWIFLVILAVAAALIYIRKKKLNRYEMKESKGLKSILGVLVLGLNFGNVVFGNLTNDIYSVAISVHTRGGKLLATFGIISKKIQKAFDIDNEVYYAEINWKELMKAIKSSKVNFKELSKFPAVKRDLALLIDKNVQFAEIEKIAYETEKKLLKEVELFDVYEGKNLEPGKKSYAVSFLLQDENATLNDKQIDKIMSKLIANLESKLNAKLR